MKRIFCKLLVCSCLLLSISCKNETETLNVDLGYNYFPDDSGTFVIYRVDSTLYNDFTRPVEVRRVTKYLKEKITDQHLDNLGRLARIVERTYSDTLPAGIWPSFNSEAYIVKTKTALERWEDNLRYIKLIFPNNGGRSWLGNKFIIDPPPYILDSTNYRVEDWNYTIQDRDKIFDNGYKIFDSTLTVFQIYDSSAINKTYSIEKYARNVGMVYKELWIVTGQTISDSSWDIRAEKGFILKQYAIDYGKE